MLDRCPADEPSRSGDEDVFEILVSHFLALHAANVPHDRMPRRKLVTTDALARALDEVTCPVWALYGREDALYRHTWLRLEAGWLRVPRLRELLAVPEAGHWVQFEEPATVNAWLARVLQS